MSPSKVPATVQAPLEGDKEFDLALEDLHRGMVDYREQLFEDLEATVAVPLRKAFAEAFEAHTRLVGEAGLDGATGDSQGDPGADPAITPLARRGRRFRRYREGVRDEVLEPLRTALRELAIGETIGSRWVGFQNGLSGLSDPLPDLIVRTEPEDLYGTRAGDGRITTLLKGMIRTGRWIGDSVAAFGRRLARLVGRRPTPPPPRTQEVPLRPLAKDLLLFHYPLSFRGIADSLQDHYARPVALLGTALSRWADDWFDAEARAQTAEGQLGARFRDEILRGITPRPDSRADSPGDEPELGEEPEEEAPPTSPGPAETEDVSLVLSEALQSGASLPPPVESMERVLKTMEGEWENLLEAIRVAGSFQESSIGRRMPVRVRRLLDRDQAQTEAWQNWHLNSLERLLVAILLLRLRDGFDQAEDGLRGRIVEEALAPLTAPWKETASKLRLLEGRAEKTFSSFRPGGATSDLASDLDALRVEAQAFLESDLFGVLTQVQPDAVIRQVADEVSGAFSDSLRFLPDSVQVAPLHQGTGRISPTQSVKELPFRETVHRTLDVLRLESIRNSPAPLLSFLETAATECVELPNVISYNLSMAAEELRSHQEDSSEKAISDARSLTKDGLTRTADWVENLLENLASAWMDFTGEIHRLLQSSFAEIHSRAVAEGAVEEQMRGLRAWTRNRLRAGTGRGRVTAQRANRVLHRYLRRGWVLGARLVRMGQSAVGVQVSREGETGRTLEALRQIPDLLESLPLVYKRLFSLSPVLDPGLLVGRDAELAWVAHRLEGWKVGYCVPCLLTGPVGIGHTSFLNVLEATKLKDYETHRIDLNTRIGSEASLASLIASTLGLADDGPWTLSGLARRLQDMPLAPEEPLIILVEHLEHLFLRVPGGTDLLEDFLSFQALTANRVFWLSTTSGAAWKLLEKNEPRAAGLLARLPLSPLSRGDMEKVIFDRHRRSGLPLDFIQPTDLNPLIRRKLRLSRSEKAKQEIIRTEYFDRAFRASGNSVALAMLTWLRSADFTSKEGRLLVSPSHPVRFSFLEELDLSLDFALKAFLEHGSLTLEEYEMVFNAPEEEAFQVFEALRNLFLIRPVEARGESPSRFETTEAGKRYRVRPLLSQVVADHLKSRNILH